MIRDLPAPDLLRRLVRHAIFVQLPLLVAVVNKDHGLLLAVRKAPFVRIEHEALERRQPRRLLVLNGKSTSSRREGLETEKGVAAERLNAFVQEFFGLGIDHCRTRGRLRLGRFLRLDRLAETRGEGRQ